MPIKALGEMNTQRAHTLAKGILLTEVYTVLKVLIGWSTLILAPRSSHVCWQLNDLD